MTFKSTSSIFSGSFFAAQAFLFLVSTCFNPVVPNAEAGDLWVSAPSAVIIDRDTGDILYSKARNVKRAPASTVKILTALVVMDHMGLDDWVTVDSDVELVQPKKMYLKGGERLRVRDLLKAILMNSANDAAMALAIAVAGTEYKFGRMMTEKAHQLGAVNSNFHRASGLPAKGQYSTAYDLALIMRAATYNSFIMSVLKMKEDSISTAEGKNYYLKSHNKMLYRDDYVLGKTGWTRRAQYCFIGLAKRGNRDVIISLLGSKQFWTDVTNLARGYGGGSSKKYLSYGARGSSVVEIQNALKKAGYFKARSTGYFGTITDKSVRNFQRDKKLKVDGIVGPQTKKALAPYM